MKKLLAVLLTIVMVLSSVTFTAFAATVEVSDELYEAIVAYKNYKDLEKSDISLYYCDHIADDKYLVKYSFKNSAVSCDMVLMEVGDYRLYSSRPLPMIFADGAIYGVEEAFEKGVLSNSDLRIMSGFPQLNMVHNKITWDLQDDLGYYEMDDYVNIRFEVQGSEKKIGDIENWVNDVSGANKKLMAHYEEIHQKLVDEVLRDIDHIERVHNNGISIIAIKKADIEKVSMSEFVTEMDYISEIHMKYIDTFNPTLGEYNYEEKCAETDGNGEMSYYLIKANMGYSAFAEVGFRFGNCIVQSDINSNFTYLFGIYDIKEDKFYDVYDLRKTPDKYYRLEVHLEFYSRARVAGDYDFDRNITILDATGIQRFVAKLEYLPLGDQYVSHEGNESGFISDFDNDGKVTVMDATGIQFHLARFDMPATFDQI